MNRSVEGPVRGVSATSDPGGSTVRRRSAMLVLATATVLTVSACDPLGIGAGSPTSPAETGSATAPTASTPPPSPTTPATRTSTPATGASATGYSTLSGGNGSASVLVLAENAVPSGWSVSQPRDTGGYRMTICGVDLEPDAPVDGAQKRWQASSSGPFLEEHVRVYTGSTAREVTAALARALPRCPRYTTTDSNGGSATYTVERLTVPGAAPGTVTWRQRLTMPAPPAATPSASTSARATVPPSPSPSATAAPRAPVLIQDVAVARKGSSVVLLSSYSVDTPPQPQVLAGALRALAAKPG